jgi:hypothetical protein
MTREKLQADGNPYPDGYPTQDQKAFDELERQVRFWRGAFQNERNAVLDLKRHLRDRDAHIANLEAQLKPYIGRDIDAGEQEALL